MTKRICYLGDGSLSGAASYLGGVMLHYGLAFDHVPSDRPPPADFAATPYALYVVSDYPAAVFGAAAMECVARRVERDGVGLLMIGGWESFFGRLGEYPGTPLADVLPIVMAGADDRRNAAQPCLVEQKLEHPILAGLPWETPPGIGGYNAVSPKNGTQTLLTAVRFHVRRERGVQAPFSAPKDRKVSQSPADESGTAPFADEFHFTRGEEAPLLVVGRHGAGRAAALATDVAPHWVGGWVDWGDRRITQDVADGFIEVGNWYAEFFRNLLMWTGNL